MIYIKGRHTMKKAAVLVIIMIMGFAVPSFAGMSGTEISLSDYYGASSDYRSGQRYELWRVLANAGYTELADDIRLDVTGGVTSSAYHVYKDTYWKADGYSNHLIAEIAGYAPYNNFGWYEKGGAVDIGDLSSTAWGKIFSGPDSAGATASIANSAEIGFWLNPNSAIGRYYFTDTALNLNNNLQAVTFSLGGYQGFTFGDYLVCFEDVNYLYGSDRDYQDMIVKVRAATVPEPATMALTAFGLSAIGLRKKRRNG